MPEYLAPGVYVEEIPSSNKPIQAASTSTAGMVGLTERGPVNTPTLITSSGAFNRIFGGKLNPQQFLNSLDSLPHAAEGFFTNGGSRLYVVRILGGAAQASSIEHFASAGTAPSTLSANAAAGAGEILLEDASLLMGGTTILISNGVDSETITLPDPLVIETRLGVNSLTHSFIVEPSTDATLQTETLVENIGALSSGDNVITVIDSSVFPVTEIFILRDPDNNNAELVEILAHPSGVGIEIASPLIQDYGINTVINSIVVPDTNVHLQTEIQSTTTTSDVSSGGTTIQVVSSGAFIDGQTVLIRDVSTNAEELVEIDGAPASPTEIQVTLPLTNDYISGANIFSLGDGVENTLDENANASIAPTTLNLAGGPDPTTSIGDYIRIENGTDVEYQRVVSLPHMLSIGAPLLSNHGAGTQITANVTDVLTVHARWPGAWGDSLHVSSRASSQVETTSVGVTAAGNSMQLITAFGLFPGSVVTVTPSNGDPVFSREVATVDVATGIVTFTAAILETPDNSGVVSQEFSLLIERVVDGKTVESEFFEKLSLASEHPRYALKILGSWDTASATPSETGDSSLVRLSDNADATTRVMPLVHDLRRPMDGGSDDVAGIDDNSFIGVKADDPDVRTGIQALENEPTISLVAVPGQTSVNVQKELLTHCEKMRYRFAVLDTPLGSNLQQARTHRQNFDSTRAAIYYPGLVIPDQFGDKGATRVIPSSGHTVGVYARTDVVRGVHKVPANEVVRGIQRFEIGLTKGAQDILNPIHVNCHRDFRSENRGLRVYGGRVATSDPEFRYVNVRRLMLFIEQSLDVGLQWAVFEPNSEPLWASVKQSVTGFLNTVWRSGALEGTVQEEAFFVNIGYDVTMTQTDVDNGRMIVEIGVAPVKPAEFVIARISQKTRDAVS